MRKSVKNIIWNFKYIKKKMLWFFVLWLLADTMILTIPKFIEKLLSIIETSKNIDELLLYGWIFAAVVLVFVFVDRWFHLVATRSYGHLYIAKEKFYRSKYLKLDYQHILDIGTGKAISRMEKWIHAETSIFFAIVNILLHTLFRGTVIMIIFFHYEPILAFTLLGVFVSVFLFNSFFYKRLKPITIKQQKLDDDVSRNKIRLIMEFLLVNIFNKQATELSKWIKLLDKYPKLDVLSNLYQFTFYDVLHLLLRLTEILIYVLVGTLVIKGEASISYLVMLAWYLWFLWVPIEKSVSEMGRINRNIISYQKLQEFINKENKVKDGTKHFKLKKWRIKIENLSFGYDSKEQIFDKLDLDIPAGKTTALVWHSWSGKSTLIKLLLRLYDIDNGKILFDWQDLKTLKTKSVYQHLWYLSQEPAIFDWTVRENLEYALADWLKYNDKVLRDALQKAQAETFVRKMDKSLESEIWEKWVKLSWWERQRLAIARIFLKNPEILILDEPTSALDSVSESKITKVLKDMMKNRTVIVIAHRLQTVQHADQIIVLENWKIIEAGKHDELLTQKKHYAQLVDLQHGKILE